MLAQGDEMLRNIIIGLVVLIVAIVGFGLTLPEKTSVERSTVISATPEKVFGVVNDFKNFNKFSPWFDPEAKYTIEGPASGVGQKLTWSGGSMGEGTQEIIASEPSKLVRVALDFGFGSPKAEFVLAPQTDGTKVTWRFDEESGWNVPDRYMAWFFVESEVGKSYEKGLVNLKGLVEGMPNTVATPAAAASTATTTTAATTPVGKSTSQFDLLIDSAMKPGDPPVVVTLEAQPVVMTRRTASTDPAKGEETAQIIGGAYGAISQYIEENGLTAAGAPLAITASYDEAKKEWVFDAALPISEIPAEVPAEKDGVKTGLTPAGKAVMIVHKGPYTAAAPAYEAIAAYMKANGLEEGPNAIEEYSNDPGDVEESEYLTNIYFLTK